MTSEPRNCIKLSSKKETKPLNFKTNQHLLLQKSEPYAVISTYHPSVPSTVFSSVIWCRPLKRRLMTCGNPDPRSLNDGRDLVCFSKPIWRIVVSFCSMNYLICLFKSFVYPHSSETWVTWTTNDGSLFLPWGSSATAPLQQSLLWSERCL